MYPESIEIKGKKFFLEVYYKSKKNASVSQNGDTLRFYFPKGLSKSKEQEIFGKLLRSMSKKAEVKEDCFKNALERREFWFAGEHYYISFYKGIKYKLEVNTFYVPYKSNDPVNIEKNIVRLLKDRFESRIREYVKAVNSQTFDYKVKDVVLANYKSKYGHCTQDNVIAINMKVLNAPRKVLDYIVIHELAHVEVKNHSRNFWRLVEKFYPDHKNIRNYLRKKPPALFET